MNLLEALKSGKPLRRKDCQRHMGNSGGWLRNSYVESMLETDENLRREDFFADDWEVKDEESVHWVAWGMCGIDGITKISLVVNTDEISTRGWIRLPHLNPPKGWKP